MSSIQSDEALYGLLARAGEAKRVAAGEIIFEKGTRGDTVFVVSSGVVSLMDGEQTIASVHGPGLFGEMALIESKPRALTAAAGTDADLAEIPARTFWVLVNETPYIAQLVMRVMTERLRQATGT
jgi:CRP-like cAMP-binding protein